jgi:hypothetical protein
LEAEMTPKPQLYERLLTLHDKYDDPEIARCAILAVEIRDELRRTRWDRAREWTILAFIVAYAVKTITPWVQSWL